MLFTYVGGGDAKESTLSPNTSPTIKFPKSPMNNSESLDELQHLIQSVEDLKKSLLIEVHYLGGKKPVKKSSLDDSEDSSTLEESSDDDENDEILERDQ